MEADCWLDPGMGTGRAHRPGLLRFFPRGAAVAEHQLAGWPACTVLPEKSAPWSVNTTWRALPLLDLRIATVPASGLKSCISKRTSSL